MKRALGKMSLMWGWAIAMAAGSDEIRTGHAFTACLLAFMAFAAFFGGVAFVFAASFNDGRNS